MNIVRRVDRLDKLEREVLFGCDYVVGDADSPIVGTGLCERDVCYATVRFSKSRRVHANLRVIKLMYASELKDTRNRSAKSGAFP